MHAGSIPGEECNPVIKHSFWLGLIPLQSPRSQTAPAPHTDDFSISPFPHPHNYTNNANSVSITKTEMLQKKKRKKTKHRGWEAGEEVFYSMNEMSTSRFCPITERPNRRVTGSTAMTTTAG